MATVTMERTTAAPPVVATMPRAKVYSKRGAISTAHPLAAQAGIDIMRRGGNVVDAALATAATLVVVEPHMNHLGGDAFIQVYDAKRGNVTAFNSNGPAPHLATQELFAAHGIPPNGPLSASVPGMIDGWFAVHEKYGTMPMKDLLASATDYAEHGFPVSFRLSQAMTSLQALLARFPASAKQFLKPDGQPYQPGETLVQPDLAKTFKLLADGGREAFYNGPVAEAIWRWSQRDGALFGLRDLADFRGEILKPLTTTYRGYTICETPPTSQGYLVLQALNLLEGHDLAKLGPDHPQAMHLQIEALRVAMTDRQAYVGDPRFVPNHVPTLISKAYAQQRARDLNPIRASANLQPGAIKGGDTTYFCAVDKDGNAVSWMQSLFAGFGSGVVVPGTGVLLNNRMTGFSTDPNHPNVVAPGKRTVHTLNTYTVLNKDGDLVMVGGSPGGMMQVQTNTQILCNIFEHKLDVQAAIEAPRWTWHSDLDVTVENRAHAAVEGLIERGYRATSIGSWDGSGRVHAIIIDRENGCYIGGADPRAEGVAVGY